MKILHLSDLHIGNWLNFIDEDENFEVICERIIEKWGNDKDEDKPVILITGDITDSGTDKQYRKARSIIKTLRIEGFTLYMAPGNHDFGLKGNVATKKSFKKFKKYLFGLERISYPLVNIRETKSQPIAFIGLNSMKGECKDHERFLADGELGASQLEELEEILNDIEKLEETEDRTYIKIVYLHHHPFILPDDKKSFFKEMAERWTHALDDGKVLMSHISNNRIHALLFGHDHDHVDFRTAAPGDQPLTEFYKIPYILSCGKSTKKENENFPAWLIQIDENGKISVDQPDFG